ncbi:MAG: LysE family transporter [Candidatus Methanospirareceae archaeon]
MEPFIIGASLVGIGFLTGLSGALIPGPMLAYVVSDTLKKGPLSGPLTVLGHISVEILLIAAFVLGLGLTSYFLKFKSMIYVIGGIALIVMSLLIIKDGKGARSWSRESGVDNESRGMEYGYNSSILGGVLFTAFNPSFIPWWVTIGYPLVLQGFEWLAMTGIVLVTIGHFLSDLTWYSFISYSFYKGTNLFLGKRYELMQLVITVFVIVLGLFFFIKGAIGFF